jgi:hypothetical protein
MTMHDMQSQTTSSGKCVQAISVQAVNRAPGAVDRQLGAVQGASRQVGEDEMVEGLEEATGAAAGRDGRTPDHVQAQGKL